MSNQPFLRSKNQGVKHSMDIAPDPARFKTAKQAADAWTKKHPNPIRFCRTRGTAPYANPKQSD